MPRRHTTTQAPTTTPVSKTLKPKASFSGPGLPSEAPSNFSLVPGQPELNARKRVFLRTVIELMRDGYSRGLDRHQIYAAVKSKWPQLQDKVLARPYNAMRRWFAIDVYGKREHEQRLDVLIVLDRIIADPFASATDRIAALKEKARLLGLHAPVRVEQSITARTTHEVTIRTLQEAARTDDATRELVLQLGRRLKASAASNGNAQPCCN